MTIYISKKPFEIAFKVIKYCFMLSWIPILAILIYQSNRIGDWKLMLLTIPFCFFQIFFSIIWLEENNENKHWVKWSDDKPGMENKN